MLHDTSVSDSAISLHSMKTKLAWKGVQVSHTTIAAHLIALRYNKKLPKATLMLTEAHKQRQVGL